MFKDANKDTYIDIVREQRKNYGILKKKMEDIFSDLDNSQDENPLMKETVDVKSATFFSLDPNNALILDI